MHLVIFDIDGTLTDSAGLDDELFLRSFKDIFRLEISSEKWENYKLLSSFNDNSIVSMVLEKECGLAQHSEELSKLKAHYLNLLESNSDLIHEIEHSTMFYHLIKSQRDYKVAIATGSWRKAGIIKLNAIKMDVDKISYSNADLHDNRKDIISEAIAQAEFYNKDESFDKITYLGDGEWDYNAANQLGINFIGVDNQLNGKLKELGVTKIINDYKNIDLIFDYLID
jgi:phosphoglycolate phosphatase-like HAD superfamily hydrolase